MELAQDRVQWRASVLAVLNLRGLPPQREISDSEGGVGLLQRDYTALFLESCPSY
jgi:hypothetical protein